MNTGEKINWIVGAPVGIAIRNIDYVAPHAHDGVIELILCLTGKVKVSYCFEEFTLDQGEFILVDKDAHIIYGQEPGICASIYIDLASFNKKYPYIDSIFFVCEGTKQSKVPYNTTNHKYLKAMLLTMLTIVLEHDGETAEYIKNVNKIASNIVDLLLDKFDIIFWYHPDMSIKPDALLRYRMMSDYVAKRQKEKIDISDLAEAFQLSNVYVSEFLSSVSLGFRRMLNFTRACSAEKMLIDTQMNILDISEACGFSDPKYLYESFNIWYKCTPHQFRKKYLSEAGKNNIETYLPISDIAKPLEDMRKEHFIDWFM
jgi:AraC-like DNA-binding protein